MNKIYISFKRKNVDVIFLFKLYIYFSCHVFSYYCVALTFYICVNLHISNNLEEI